MKNAKIIQAGAVKQAAREILLGKWRRHVAVTAVILMGMTAIPMVTGLFGPGLPASAMSLLAGIIMEMLVGLLVDGGFFYCLHLADGTEAALNDVFAPYRLQPDRFLIAELIRVAACTVPMLPSLLILFLSRDPLSLKWLMTALCIIGVFLSLLIRLALSFTPFLLLRDGTKGAIAAVRESLRLTRPHLLRLLLFALSFAGYLLLGIVTGSVGFLWIIPYYMFSLTLYYIEACEKPL